MSAEPPTDNNHVNDINQLDLGPNTIEKREQQIQEEIPNDSIDLETTSEPKERSEIKSNITKTRRKHSTQYKLKAETIYKLVDHSIGAIALDCGYHIVHQASLDLLNDVCCDYLTKISTLFRLSHETEDLRDSNSDFVDSLERVFHQINIPSIANLHQFICKLDAINKKCNN